MKYSEYKKYISGTYENLSYKERMYYVDFIKNSQNQNSNDLKIVYDDFITGYHEDNSLNENIILFFFDCIKYLYNKQVFDKNIFISLNIEYISNIDDIDNIQYIDKFNRIYIHYKSYNESNMYKSYTGFWFDCDLMNNEYLHDKMKDQIRIIMNDCSKNIKQYQKLIDDNKKKIDTLLSKFHFFFLKCREELMIKNLHI